MMRSLCFAGFVLAVVLGVSAEAGEVELVPVASHDGCVGELSDAEYSCRTLGNGSRFDDCVIGYMTYEFPTEYDLKGGRFYCKTDRPECKQAKTDKEGRRLSCPISTKPPPSKVT